jgi:hypothetical protein
MARPTSPAPRTVRFGIRGDYGPTHPPGAGTLADTPAGSSAPPAGSEDGARRPSRTRRLRQSLHGLVRLLEQSLRGEDALAKQPLKRRGPHRVCEAACEGAPAHAGVSRHRVHRERLTEPGEPDTGWRASGHRASASWLGVRRAARLRPIRRRRCIWRPAGACPFRPAPAHSGDRAGATRAGCP